MTLDLSRLVSGQGALSADVKQFGDLLLGVMQDQPVNFKHQLSVGGGTGITAAQVPLTVLGVDGQSAHLFDVKDSTGAVQVAVDALGRLVVNGANAFFTDITASSGVTATGNVVGAGVIAQSGQLGVAGDGGSITSTQMFTSVRGVGNGANTAVQAPALGTGSGPANPLLVVDFLKVYTAAGTTRWIPLFA